MYFKVYMNQKLFYFSMMTYFQLKLNRGWILFLHSPSSFGCSKLTVGGAWLSIFPPQAVKLTSSEKNCYFSGSKWSDYDEDYQNKPFHWVNLHELTAYFKTNNMNIWIIQFWFHSNFNIYKTELLLFRNKTKSF